MKSIICNKIRWYRFNIWIDLMFVWSKNKRWNWLGTWINKSRAHVWAQIKSGHIHFFFLFFLNIYKDTKQQKYSTQYKHFRCCVTVAIVWYIYVFLELKLHHLCSITLKLLCYKSNYVKLSAKSKALIKKVLNLFFSSTWFAAKRIICVLDAPLYLMTASNNVWVLFGLFYFSYKNSHCKQAYIILINI